MSGNFNLVSNKEWFFALSCSVEAILPNKTGMKTLPITGELIIRQV